MTGHHRDTPHPGQNTLPPLPVALPLLPDPDATFAAGSRGHDDALSPPLPSMQQKRSPSQVHRNSDAYMALNGTQNLSSLSALIGRRQSGPSHFEESAGWHDALARQLQMELMAQQAAHEQRKLRRAGLPPGLSDLSSSAPASPDGESDRWRSRFSATTADPSSPRPVSQGAYDRSSGYLSPRHHFQTPVWTLESPEQGLSRRSFAPSSPRHLPAPGAGFAAHRAERTQRPNDPLQLSPFDVRSRHEDRLQLSTPSLGSPFALDFNGGSPSHSPRRQPSSPEVFKPRGRGRTFVPPQPMNYDVIFSSPERDRQHRLPKESPRRN